MTNPPSTLSAWAIDDEPQFTVPIPGVSAPAPEHVPVAHDPTPLPYAAEPAPRGTLAAASARVDSRWSRFGAALFWITVGWWIFVGVRLSEKWVRSGYSDHIFYDTVAMVREEPVVAAGISVLAALVLLLSSGRRWLGRLALAVAGATVAVAAWRLLP